MGGLIKKRHLRLDDSAELYELQLLTLLYLTMSLIVF
jgi:hypothetical protein